MGIDKRALNVVGKCFLQYFKSHVLGLSLLISLVGSDFIRFLAEVH